nr:MAG TPA: hypothetical protein [Caudoviricetes sp.]
MKVTVIKPGPKKRPLLQPFPYPSSHHQSFML